MSEQTTTTDAAPQTTTVQALSNMIKDLEEQLDRMIAINEAIEKDLANERGRRAELEQKLDETTNQLKRVEQETATSDDLQAELAHLKGERSRLADTVDTLRSQLEAEQEKTASQARIIERLRASREDALTEVDSVEAQFQRAMELVADLKTRLAIVTEDYEAIRGQVRANDDKLLRIERERDALLAEVEESRTALDDIRRSLVDACVVSQQYLEDEAGAGTAE